MFAIISIALFMSSVDLTIVATALPALQQDLDAPINWSTWTITVYALGQIVAMPVAGALSDQFGRKRLFIISAIVFTLASLCCGLATSIYALIPLRFIQALGGGGLMPSASGIVADMYGRGRDRAIGMFGIIFPLGGIVGPILGGFFVTYWSWRGIFLVNVPLGLLLIVLGAKFIPRLPPTPSAKLDLVGVALLGGLLLSAMYGVAALRSSSSGGWQLGSLAFEALAAALCAAFVWHLRRSPNPFIPPRLLIGKGFGAMNTINFLFGGAVLGFGAMVPLYAQERYGISALSAGTLLTARAVGMISVAALAVMALRRTGYRLPMFVGYLILATDLVLMAVPPWGTSTYTWLALCSGITGLGMGLSLPAANNASLQLAPTQVAAVAGLRGMFRQSGAIIAISVTATVLAAGDNPGVALGHVFIVFAVVVLLALPLILRVPDHHGTW